MDKKQIKDFVMKPIVDAGFKVYFVGGCVRDSLMGVEPHDYDLCTDATPEQLHTIFKSFSSQNSEPFGVTMPIVKGELVEIATMRRDITKGRHPKIEFTTDIKEDAMRRDFTVNDLYEDIDGQVIDPSGWGISDIHDKILRFVGSPVERVAEDPLRLFRFCRFQAQKGFNGNAGLGQGGLVALRHFLIENPPKQLFAEVSKERQLKELIGIFGGKYFMTKDDDTLSFMDLLGILDVTGIRAVFDDLASCGQNPKWHAEGSTLEITCDGKDMTVSGEEASKLFSEGKDVVVKKIIKVGNAYNHTILVMKEMAKQEHDYKDMLAALLHDIGKPVSARKNGKKNPEDLWGKTKDHDVVGAPLAYDFCKSLGMCNEDCEDIQWLVKHHMRAHQLSDMKSSCKIWRITSHPLFSRLVKLAKADEDGCRKTCHDEWYGIYAALEEPKIKVHLGIPMPKPILTGDDIIAKGYQPGPTFKKALDKAYEIQIDDDVTDKEQLFKAVKGIVKGH